MFIIEKTMESKCFSWHTSLDIPSDTLYIMVKTDIGIDTNGIGYHRISKGSAILWAKK